MRALAVSDQVLDALYRPNVQHSHPPIDLLIGCGDLPFYYLDFLVSSFDVPLFYVRGNHDGGKQYRSNGDALDSVQGGVDCHARLVTHNGITFCGLEGSMRYHPTRPHMYTETEMRTQVAKIAPQLALNKLRTGRGMDVLITHSPPFGIHDKDDLPHRGFQIFLWLLRVFRPKYMLHGHIHRTVNFEPRITQFEETTIINVYPQHTLDITL